MLKWEFDGYETTWSAHSAAKDPDTDGLHKWYSIFVDSEGNFNVSGTAVDATHGAISTTSLTMAKAWCDELESRIKPKKRSKKSGGAPCP